MWWWASLLKQLNCSGYPAILDYLNRDFKLRLFRWFRRIIYFTNSTLSKSSKPLSPVRNFTFLDLAKM